MNLFDVYNCNTVQLKSTIDGSGNATIRYRVPGGGEKVFVSNIAALTVSNANSRVRIGLNTPSGTHYLWSAQTNGAGNVVRPASLYVVLMPYDEFVCEFTGGTSGDEAQLVLQVHQRGSKE